MRIRLKIILGFLAVALYVSILAFYSHSSMAESSMKQNMFTDVKFSFEGHRSNLIGFINGDKSSEELITESYTFILNAMDEMIASSSGNEKASLQKLKELSINTHTKIFDKDNPESTMNLIEKRDTAFEDFLEKNNKHLTRVSEYKKYWGEEATNDKLTQILIKINEERTLLLDFNPAEENWETVREEFRKINDKVVDDLVSLLVDELNLYVSSIENNSELQQIKNALTVHKEIAADITATTFPAVSREQAELAGINATGKVTSSMAKAMTISLGKASETEIVNLEEKGIVIRERHDVKSVGNNRNSIQVLVSVIKCQQALRINAEDFMDSKRAIKEQMDDFYMPAHNEFNRRINELISSQEGSFRGISLTIVLSILALTGILVFGLFFSRSISKPITKLRDATREVSKGKLNTRIEIKSDDEIGDLASDFKQMTHDLKTSRIELEKYSKSLETQVAERTKGMEKTRKELESKVNELERFRKMTIGRELKMIELKKRIRELEKKA